MSEGLLGKAIQAKRKRKQELEARTGLGGGTQASAKRVSAAPAAPAKQVRRRSVETKFTIPQTTAAKASAQKAAIQKRVAARVASGKGRAVKKKRNKGARTLRGAVR